MPSLIAYPNRTDESTLSNGSWSVALPLSNLQDRNISHVARTNDATVASTKFDLVLAKMRLIRVFGIVNHNFSNAATYRIRASGEASATNLLGYSEQIDQWTLQTGVTVTTNSVTAPDGNLSGDTVAYSGAGSAGSLRVSRSATVVPAAGAVYTASVWMRAATPTIVRFSNNLGSPLVCSLNSTWQRFQLTSAGDGATPMQIAVMSAAADNSSFAIQIWGGQIETGTAATSYYPTPTATATVRPAGYMDSWQSYTYDSGVTAVWPVVYPSGVLEWETDNWWSGQMLDEDKVGFNLTLINVLPMAAYAQYFRFEFFDTANAAGYVQIGRLFLASEWVPAENMELGASIAYETPTVVDTAISGTEYFDERLTYRVAKFSINLMTENEGFAQAFDLMRVVGISKEVLYMWDMGDTVYRLRRSFMGRLRALSPIEMPYATLTKTAFEIKELL